MMIKYDEIEAGKKVALTKAVNQINKKKKANPIDQWVDYKFWIRLWKHTIKKTMNSTPEMSAANMKYPWMRGKLKAINMLKQWNQGRGGKALRMNYELFDFSFEFGGGGEKALFEDPEHTVLFGIMISNEILTAMHLKSFMVETPTNTMTWYDQNSTHAALDTLYAMGLPQDTCTYASVTPGLVMMDQIPGERCAALVCSNRPCEGGAQTWSIMEEKFGIPTYRLDVPEDFNEDGTAIDDFAEDLKSMIAWLTDITGNTLDEDELRRLCENQNRITRLQMELWELNRGPSPVFCGDLNWESSIAYMNISPGTDGGVKIFENLLKWAREAHEDGKSSVTNLKYRAVLWNPPSFIYMNFWNWLERCWGVGIVMDMETFHEPNIIDTSSVDTMLHGLAREHCYAPMSRHNRGKAENWIQGVNDIYKMFKPDFILNMNHMGCRASVGMTGVLKDWSKDNCPVCWADYDMFDNRVVSRQDIRDQINRFMQDVMHAEPLDPSLLSFDDSNDWN